VALAQGQARQFRDGGFLHPGEDRQACRKGSLALGEEGPRCIRFLGGAAGVLRPSRGASLTTPGSSRRHGLTVHPDDRAFDTSPSISTLGAQTVP
jgi:hypothetical protein